VAVGAATTVWAATVADADEVGGRYTLDCHVARLATEWDQEGVREYVYDLDRGRDLWALSEELVGETFSW
jgi:hypothetical protein